MFSLRSIFSSSHDNVPLSEMDILEVSPTQDGTDLPEEFEGRVINMRYILSTGIIPIASDLNRKIEKPERLEKPNHGVYFTDQYIDFKADDKFNEKLEEIQKAVQERIDRASWKILNEEEIWDKEDHVFWERGVNRILSQEVNKIPGFGNYRAANKYNNITRPVCLNDLSVDIENDTETLEFDCETMSLVKGIVLQRLEEYNLPKSASEGNYKVASNYFYASGIVSYENDRGAGAHAYLISSATGNIIEGTNDPDRSSTCRSYREHTDPDYSFSDFVHGKLAICKDGSIYSGERFYSTGGKVATYRVESGQIDLSGLYDGISAKWSESGIEDNGSEGKLVAAVDLASPDQVTEDDASNPPPEVQALAEIKKGIERLQRIKEAGVINDRYPYDIRIESMRNRFDEQVDDMVGNGSIYDVLKFLDDAGLVDKSSGKVEILSNAPTVTAAVSQEVAPVVDGGAKSSGLSAPSGNASM